VAAPADDARAVIPPGAAFRYFAGNGALFGAAAEVTGMQCSEYEIGGARVMVRAAGEELVACTDPALAPRRSHRSDGAAPDLVVEMWDSATSHVDIGRAPWPPDDLRPLGLVRSFCDERFLSAVDVHTASLSLFDRAGGKGRFWLEDAHRMAYWQSASPLRLILSWWAASRGMQLTHAAAVGREGGAVLLVGGAGSGKSMTSLSCMLGGLDFFGDDYCLVDPGPPPVVHPVYGTAKLRADGLALLPELRAVARNVARLDREKAILDVSQAYPARMALTAPLRAIVVPQVTGRVRVAPTTPGTVLRAMAPSTVFGLFGATSQTLPVLAQVAAEVPGFTLEVGDDLDAVTDEVAGLAEAA